MEKVVFSFLWIILIGICAGCIQTIHKKSYIISHIESEEKAPASEEQEVSGEKIEDLLSY